MEVLHKNFWSKDMSDAQMLERVEAMDNQAQEQQKIATELQAKLQKCTTNKQVVTLMDKVHPLLRETAAKLAQL